MRRLDPPGCEPDEGRGTDCHTWDPCDSVVCLRLIRPPLKPANQRQRAAYFLRSVELVSRKVAVTPAVSSRRLLALAFSLLPTALFPHCTCSLRAAWSLFPAALPVRAKETAVVQRLSLSQCRSRLLRSSTGAAFVASPLLLTPSPITLAPNKPSRRKGPVQRSTAVAGESPGPTPVDHPSDITSVAEKTKTSVAGRMPFHWPNKNNRSQHNLVGSSGDEDGPGAASAAASTGATSPNPRGAANQNPPAALSNPAFSSSESFHAHSQPPPPPPHLANLYNTASAGGPHPANIPTLQHSNTVTGSLESRQRDSDFIDPVTRSQSQRYAQVSQISPVSTQYSLPPQQQQQQQYIGSGSAEDLTAPGAQISPVPSHGQIPPQAYYAQQQAQQQSQAQPQRAKQSSTRKLFKNILGGSSSRGAEAHQHHSQQSFSSSGNSSGLGRHHSKRVSQPPAPPPAIRTGVSQISLDQQTDWQQNQPPASQTSPQHSIGDFRRESYVVTGADGELHSHPLHGVQQQQNPTIRSVPPSESEHSPYSPDDVGYHHQRQSHIQLQGQVPSEVQHQQQYQQQAFDPTQPPPPHHQQQYQFPNHHQLQYQSGGQQVYAGHLASPRQNQNAETVSQLSHESPITDSDQRSGTNIQSPQPSPAVNYATASETQDHPVRQNPPLAQAQSPQQGMTPPAGGGPPPRRSQETEKGMRDPIQPPPGPPPSYRQSQAPNMNNPLPPPPPNTGGGPNAPAYRASTIPDRPPFDGPGDVQGRNSPQPASGAGEDPEKAFKDLCETNSGLRPLSISRLKLTSWCCQ